MDVILALSYSWFGQRTVSVSDGATQLQVLLAESMTDHWWQLA